MIMDKAALSKYSNEGSSMGIRLTNKLDKHPETQCWIIQEDYDELPGTFCLFVSSYTQVQNICGQILDEHIFCLLRT